MQSHLPWYICLSRSTAFLLKGQRKARLCSPVTTAMWSGLDPSNTSSFNALIGQLLDGLIMFICTELNLKIKHILRFAKVNAASSSIGRHTQFDESEMMKLHQAFVRDPTVKLSLYPPNCTSVLLHPHWLVFLLSKLPRKSQVMDTTLERFSIPVSKPITDYVQKSPAEICKARIMFCKSIYDSALGRIAITLQQFPLLARAQLNHCDNCGPVQFALFHRQCCVPILLYLHGSDMDQVDNKGFTTLHRAVMSGDLKAVQVLLELGAKTGIHTCSGMTALGIATQQRHQEIASALIVARLENQDTKTEQYDN